MAILSYTINNFNNYVIKRGAFVKCAPLNLLLSLTPRFPIFKGEGKGLPFRFLAFHRY